MSGIPRRHLAFGLCLGLGLPLLAQAAPSLDDGVRTAVKTVMAEQDIPGLAVGITAPGLRRLYYFGTADRRTGQPVDSATLFEIGSLSKTYTATLGAYAAVTGRLRLDESAAKVRPALAGSAIGQASLLQLATYTAGGLPLQFPDSVTREDQATAFYRDFQPPFPAGSRRLYANPSIGLFGALAAQRLDEPFATALQRHVLTPLGLSHTYLQVPTAEQGHYAWGHGKNGEPLRVNPGVYAEEAYGIKTTASDLLGFVEANLNPSRLPGPLAKVIAITQQGYYRSGPLTQGLGWEAYAYPLPKARLLAGNTPAMALEPQPVQWQHPPLPASGARLLNKTGSTNGFGAYALFIPERQIGVVILANRNYPIPARIEAAWRILQQLDSKVQ
ncbi:class C beta-lactamase [Pseudomonas oryzihabitans]|uniref:class C beta-lactamase n=1 Tax=Pseudomonas oryzihabitans TaxID=47885 RepID=UPI002857B891|nr:class C beta-lactamase [Pseudomonas psychrotolerans]MDR6676895.1 beta-lactamase class C [Pseudomonas psychrotolerans]